MALPKSHQLESMQQHRGDSKAADILAVNIVCTIIVYFTVALRLYARRFVPTQHQADDWLIVLAAVMIDRELNPHFRGTNRCSGPLHRLRYELHCID